MSGVPLGHSFGYSLCLLCQGEEAGRPGTGFSTSVSSGSYSSCAALSAQPAGSAFQPSLSPTSIGNLAISRQTIPTATATPGP